MVTAVGQVPAGPVKPRSPSSGPSPAPSRTWTARKCGGGCNTTASKTASDTWSATEQLAPRTRTSSLPPP